MKTTKVTLYTEGEIGVGEGGVVVGKNYIEKHCVLNMNFLTGIFGVYSSLGFHIFTPEFVINNL